MVLRVRLPYLDALGEMSYPTAKAIPVFLNGDLVNAIGSCQLIDDDELWGFLWLDTDVSKDLFLYYLGDASVRDCFHFVGLHLRQKPLRKVRWKESRVIQMPRYETGKEKRTKRLRDVVI